VFSNAYDVPSRPVPSGETPSKPTSKTTPKSGVGSVVSSLRLPQTGDASSSAWMGIGLLALAAIAVGMVLRRYGGDGGEV
jgi:LPXTG-motif cell wall-anchored protein